jgi:hypothetical protein
MNALVHESIGLEFIGLKFVSLGFDLIPWIECLSAWVYRYGVCKFGFWLNFMDWMPQCMSL